MRKYETIYILQPDLGEDEIKIVSDKVQDVIATCNGDFLRLEDWGVRKLAYSIRKFNRGRYMYLRFDGAREAISELERRLRLDERVLRYQSVNITDLPEKVVAEKKAPAFEPETSEDSETAAPEADAATADE